MCVSVQGGMGRQRGAGDQHMLHTHTRTHTNTHTHTHSRCMTSLVCASDCMRLTALCMQVVLKVSDLSQYTNFTSFCNDMRAYARIRACSQSGLFVPVLAVSLDLNKGLGVTVMPRLSGDLNHL